MMPKRHACFGLGAVIGRIAYQGPVWAEDVQILVCAKIVVGCAESYGAIDLKKGLACRVCFFDETIIH